MLWPWALPVSLSAPAWPPPALPLWLSGLRVGCGVGRTLTHWLSLWQGCFTHTVMFYGHYSNATLNQPCGSPLDGSQCTPRAGGLPYNMPLAYLYTVGAGFFISCITLVYR